MRELRPTYSDGSYLNANKTWHQEDSPYKANLVKKAIARSGITFGSCADVGCGAGLVTELLARGFPSARFEGFEMSGDAAQFWEQREPLSNLSYKLENVLESERKFDLIVCLDVFEHIEDYFGFLRALRQRATEFIFNIPLDMVIMKLLTPGIRFAREEVGHLHYFNRYTAIQTLVDTGYHVRDTFLTSAYTATMPRNIRQAAILPIRLLSLGLGKRAASALFGGITLVVSASSA